MGPRCCTAASNRATSRPTTGSPSGIASGAGLRERFHDASSMTVPMHHIVERGCDIP